MTIPSNPNEWVRWAIIENGNPPTIVDNAPSRSAARALQTSYKERGQNVIIRDRFKPGWYVVRGNLVHGRAALEGSNA